MKTIIKSEFFNLACLSLFASLILFYRFETADNFQFIFLIWNLFLAWIPYIVIVGLKREASILQVLIQLGIWFLFLPNAPYMITDMLHLRPRTEAPYWLDTFVLFVFAFNGILLFYASTKKVWHYLNDINRNLPFVVMPVSFISCGYGIYVGRWLRFNSWDAFHHPFKLTGSLMHHTFNSVNFLVVAQVTLLFGAMLFLVFRVLHSLR